MTSKTEEEVSREALLAMVANRHIPALALVGAAVEYARLFGTPGEQMLAQELHACVARVTKLAMMPVEGRAN